jgi:hypothetical protein
MTPSLIRRIKRSNCTRLAFPARPYQPNLPLVTSSNGRALSTAPATTRRQLGRQEVKLSSKRIGACHLIESGKDRECALHEMLHASWE